MPPPTGCPRNGWSGMPPPTGWPMKGWPAEGLSGMPPPTGCPRNGLSGMPPPTGCPMNGALKGRAEGVSLEGHWRAGPEGPYDPSVFVAAYALEGDWLAIMENGFFGALWYESVGGAAVGLEDEGLGAALEG